MEHTHIQSNMNIFSQSQYENEKSNVFDLSSDRKFSGKIGNLIPIFCMETLPGDKITINPKMFTRFAPMVAPPMHAFKQTCHYFFVPNRILWSNWEKFITGGEDGNYVVGQPYIDLALRAEPIGGLADYFGLPVGQKDVPFTGSTRINALPFQAYQKIYDDYYRDQNLEPSDYTELGNGANTKGTRLTMRKRAYSQSYFTSALPWTQRGPEALLPLTGDAPVVVKPFADISTPFSRFRLSSDGNPSLNSQANIAKGYDASDTQSEKLNLATGGNPSGYIDLMDTHKADLSQVSSTAIIDLRNAFALQRYLEAMARGGSRYVEYLKVIFNVSSSDKRLQRPEFLGGYTQPVKFSEVLQTSASAYEGQGGEPAISTPQGTQAGHGVSIGSGTTISCNVEEHGFVIGVMSVTPVQAYQNGIHKMWFRSDRFDHYLPHFQHVGEQAILNKELFLDTNRDVHEQVFGYTPRYSEYKYMHSSVHGEFRDTLDFWHAGRKFSTQPNLNSDFIRIDQSAHNRIFAVPDDGTSKTDHLYCHVINSVKAKRKMAVFANPGLTRM